MPDPIRKHLEVLADALANPGEGRPVGDLDRAAQALGGWLLEQFASEQHTATYEALCDLHPDTWKEVAEVAIRAARGEFDCRPFTMLPDLQR